MIPAQTSEERELYEYVIANPETLYTTCIEDAIIITFRALYTEMYIHL